MADNNEMATLSRISKSLDGLTCRQAKRALEFVGARLYERILAEDPKLAAEIAGQVLPITGSDAGDHLPSASAIPTPLHSMEG